MNAVNFRHEVKHYINNFDYIVIRSRLQQIMRSDKNSDENGEYKIRSLYFDNLNDGALMDKINGVNHREKFRIRFYNDDHSFIRLEKKSKINRLVNKISCSINREECELLLAGDIEFLKDSKRALLLELYSKMKGQFLKPKTIVDYTREAYTFPAGNVRVTFDKSVRTGIQSTKLFDKDIPTIESLDSKFIIMEVKFDEFMPEIISDLIQTNERRSASISKYAISRIYG